jgi:hypothetical protein
VRVLCETHNKIKASENHGEALLSLLNGSPAEGRKREARVQALGESLARIFTQNPTGSRDKIKREVLQDLAIRTSRLWRNACRPNGIKITQPLACFNEGKITSGVAGELRGPKDSFNCVVSERCAAAAYIYDDVVSLSKMINALHPAVIGDELAGKNENLKRRKALKELHANGPEHFNKAKCRALGDAYFAAMCPPGSVVVTTNIIDHGPLCAALGKSAKTPESGVA